MSTPRLSSSSAPVHDIAADAVLLVLPPLEELSPGALTAWTGLEDDLAALGFTGARCAVVRVPDRTTPGRAVTVVGTGPAADAGAVRDAAAAGVRAVGDVERVVVVAPAADEETTTVLAEGASLGGYSFDTYKKDGNPGRAKEIVVRSDDALPEERLAQAQAVSDAVALTKDLVTTPADRLSPADLADRARASVEGLGVDVEVLDEDALEAGGYGGILGVGRGSERPPRLVRVRYAPEGARRHVALVGKGITFDTGGLSLKPAASMVGMKYDMAGAATVLAVVRAAAALRLPIQVTAVLCVADNMPSGRATRPGDVVTIADGTSVEVLNTDAEGRLVLADGLVDASRLRPDLIVDVATLTGAIIVALGTRHTGVMGEDAAVASYIEAAERAGEDAWHLPLPAHMQEDLESPIADLQNAKIGDPAGGSLFAGLFLQHFVGRVSEEDDADRIPWVHLDIAGTGMNKGSAQGVIDKGVTGASVRSLIELLRAEANA